MVGFSKLMVVLFILMSMDSQFWIGTEMAEKWDQITYILEREDREFKCVMPKLELTSIGLKASINN